MHCIRPERQYYVSYRTALQENRERGVDTYQLMDKEENELFTTFENLRTGKNLSKGWVKATYLWMIDEGSFVGEIDIRHSLTDALLHFGGNIGYSVRPSRWGEGIGTQMLGVGLDYCKRVLHLQRVLIICNDDNYGSIRVIEKNGGILQDTIQQTIEGKDLLTRRYWISLLLPLKRNEEYNY